ncbi:ABC transporter permease [Candidatus Fermentibacterales bacterium]|nr:ABC transporter permease [Candidatus Fermentibacterales bacterium]
MRAARNALRIGRVELLLYFRDHSAFFFTLIFPLMLMLLFGSMWGNSPFEGEAFGFIDFSVSAFMAMVIATSGIMVLTTNIAAYRERGILRRFRASPASPVAVLLGEVIAVFAVTIAGVVLLLLAAIVLWGVRFWGSLPEFLAAFLLCSISLAGLGFIPASLARTARGGLVAANLLYFPMLFLSGAAVPFRMLPPFLKGFAQALPLTHAVRLMQGVWLGGSLLDYPLELAVLVAVMLAGLLVACLFFRWE